MTLYTILSRHFRGAPVYGIDGLNVEESRKRLAAMTAKERHSIRYLYGHMAYGWHRYLNTDARYFTFVRHPVARIISHYDYVRFRAPQGHYLHDAVIQSNMSLADYVTSGISEELNNGQVRLLAGVEDPVQIPYGPSRLPYGTNDAALLDQALANIDQSFFLAGLQERFDESLILIGDALGIEDLTYRRTNARGKPPSPLSNADRGVILAYNQLDLQLYEIMRRRLESEIANRPNINRSLSILRARNNFSARVRAQTNRVPRPIRSRLAALRRKHHDIRGSA